METSEYCVKSVQSHYYSSVFIINFAFLRCIDCYFEQISHIVLVLPLLSLKTSKCLREKKKADQIRNPGVSGFYKSRSKKSLNQKC